MPACMLRVAWLPAAVTVPPTHVYNNTVSLFAGLLNGAKSVANDACLYSEDYVTRLAEEKLQGSSRDIVSAGGGRGGACINDLPRASC